MGIELREVLKRLCVEIGWSYAVYWRAMGLPSPKHLVWEDGHWFGKPQFSGRDDANSHVSSLPEFQSLGEGSMHELVFKAMVPRVHVVGVGIVGQAAAAGIHEWILRDVSSDSESVLKHFAELHDQFLAGIQTVVILPVLPYGVVQFGSTKRVMENILFLDHSRTSFMQLECKKGLSFNSFEQKVCSQNSLSHASISPAASDYPFRDDCSNVDRSLSMRCSHQLFISSPSRSSSQTSYSLVMGIQENLSNNKPEWLSAQIEKVASLPFANFCQPVIHPAGKSPFQLNDSLEDGMTEPWAMPCGNLVSPSGIPLSSSNLSFVEENLISVCGGKTQKPAISIKASVNGKFGEFDTDCMLPKTETLDLGRLTTVSASTIENVQTPNSNVSCTNPAVMTQNIAVSCGNHAILRTSQAGTSSNKSLGVSIPGNLKWDNDLSQSYSVSSISCYGLTFESLQEDSFGNPSNIGPSQGIEGENSFGDHSCKIEKRECVSVENDSSCFLVPIGRSSSFSSRANSGDDLFEVLGLSGSLDRVVASDQHWAADLAACTAKLNIPPIYSMNDGISCTPIFSESNSDQLLDAVISKVSSSTLQCGSPSNDGSTSSGQKLGEYVSSSVLTSNAEAAASTSVRSADSFDKTERPGLYKSQISLWVESGQNMKSDNIFASHGKRVDGISKGNRKRQRIGETPRPRPKDRQLIMDRVKELREIVPNGAKCSIDTLLEKTIKHMIFLQSVAKHADTPKETGEPKIISKDGVRRLIDNFHGGATWAFEVGSQTMTCPILVEDLNPPREMLVEMLCEERGLFLETADLIRGLGLTILKGVMEARKDKIWARFAVEANRDVTRMELFLSLVHLLEPTVGGGAIPLSIHNSKMPHKRFNHARVPATGSDSLQ